MQARGDGVSNEGCVCVCVCVCGEKKMELSCETLSKMVGVEGKEEIKEDFQISTWCGCIDGDAVY